MIPLPQVSGKRYGVIGLGKSGRAAIAALHAGGAEVLAWDDTVETPCRTAAARHDFRAGAWPAMAGVGLESLACRFGHPAPAPGGGAGPGARPARCSPTSTCWPRPWHRARPWSAFTGTNGKSTTTALLRPRAGKTAGRTAVAGGNIGAAALDLPALGD